MLQTLSDTVRSTIRAARRREIESFIRYYYFPQGLRRKIAARLELADEQAVERVLLGLREYFLLCLDGKGLVLGMPSKAVDAAWHEFIVYTRDYIYFCQKAFGDYLHHIPDDAPGDDDDFLSGPGRAWVAVACTWIVSCRRSGQNPRKPVEVPLLFSLDAELGIPGGEVFTLEGLAALPIPSGFIETEPGRYRYIARKAQKSRRPRNQVGYGGHHSGGVGCGGAVGGGGGGGDSSGGGGGCSGGGGCGGGS